MLKKILLKIPYPKLLLLLISLYVGRLILSDANNFYFHPVLNQLGYFGTFLAGIFLGYGFTFSPAAAVIMLAGQSQYIVLAGLAASAGSLIGNYIIFRMVRISFEDEIHAISNKKLFTAFLNFLNRHIPAFVRRYILPVFAGIIVATPLPDEFGVAIIAASHKISMPIFSAVSFIFSTFGIFILLALGRLL